MTSKRSNTETTYFDYFQQLYDSWESSMTQAVDTWLKGTGPPGSSRNAAEKSEELKSYMHEIMDRTLSNRFIPLRQDLQRVTDSLSRIQDKLTDLTTEIDGLESKIREKVPHSGPKAAQVKDKPAPKGKTKTSRRKKQ